ncbi:MAG: methyl-accepting chemotaxis protein [Calditerrivibrio sp.]|nr:methyl-accepting chemotaxis protein [Calditerrivibrio sp.]
MSIRAKLILSFSLMFLMILSVSIYSYLNNKRNGYFVEDMYKTKMKSVENMFRIYRNTTNAFDNLLLIQRDLKDVGIDKLIEKSRKSYVFLDEANRSLELIKDKVTSETFPELMVSMGKLLSLTGNVTKSLELKDTPKASEQIDEIADEVGNTKELILAVVDDIQFGAKDFYDNSVKIYKMSIVILSSVIVASVVIFILISFFLERGVINPINNTTNMLKDISEGEGDLTKQILVKDGKKDEISQLATYFNSFVSKLEGIVRDLRGLADQNNEETRSIATIMEELDNTASSLNDIVSSLSSSIEEMSSNVRVIADNSNELTLMAEDVDSSVSEGSKSVEESINRIGRIGRETGQLSEVFMAFNESVKKIEEVVNVINDIADQTNLLALNAAIEAARAGEYGRGFAVVADEVRKLASKTSDSTKEIEDIAKSVSRESTTVQNKIENVNSEVAVGIEKVSKLNMVFDRIAHNVEGLKNKINEINISINEQSVAMGELAVQTNNLTLSAQNVKNSLDMGVESSNNLEKIVGNMNRIVGVFKIKS